MDNQALLQLLKGAEESSASPSKSERENSDNCEHKAEKNPYSQKDLHSFIKRTGFAIDEVPQFSEMARVMNPTIKQDVVKKDLTNLDNHDSIEDISPLKKNAEREMQVKKEALRKLIAKYKG